MFILIADLSHFKSKYGFGEVLTFIMAFCKKKSLQWIYTGLLKSDVFPSIQVSGSHGQSIKPMLLNKMEV